MVVKDLKISFPRVDYGCILNIKKTCPCNVYPLEPHFYISKLGYTGVYLFFLFLLQNIDCGYSLEPPRHTYFSYFCSKHRLWVHVRTASAVKKSLYIAWACFRNAIEK